MRPQSRQVSATLFKLAGKASQPWMCRAQEHIKEMHSSVPVSTGSRPRFSLTPWLLASRILLHLTVMLVVWPVRRPKPRFCHLGMCTCKIGPVTLCASSSRGVSVTGKMLLTRHWFGAYLTKIPHAKGKQVIKQTPQPEALRAGNYFCPFSQVYLLCLHEVLWHQDAIWRREIQFNRVREASRPDALFDSE